MDINDIFERLFNYFQTSTIRELSEKINMSESTVSKWRQRESINAIKKRCRELGIYNEIFGDSFNTFTQTGANSQQIKNQNNTGNGAGAFHYANDPKTQIDNNLNIDSELIPLFQALSSVASALNKKEQLKGELTNLISKLPTL